MCKNAKIQNLRNISQTQLLILEQKFKRKNSLASPAENLKMIFKKFNENGLKNNDILYKFKGNIPIR